MKKLQTLIISLLFVLPLFVFATDDNNITVNQAQPQFTITIPGNATTGYQWLVSAYDSQLVKEVSSSYHSNKNTKLMGAPGTFVFNFEVLSAAFNTSQQTTITFVYVRPWMTDKTDAQVKEYTVNIIKS